MGAKFLNVVIMKNKHLYVKRLQKLINTNTRLSITFFITDNVKLFTSAMDFLQLNIKFVLDRSLRRLSPQSFSSNGVPRVVIPDEVYQKGADLHKEFLVCRFFGRTPAYKLIQNVLNYLWGKGRHLEIHMVPATKSVLVRVPNEHIRQKILLKKFWYVETSMFHVAQ